MRILSPALSNPVRRPARERIVWAERPPRDFGTLFASKESRFCETQNSHPPQRTRRFDSSASESGQRRGIFGAGRRKRCEFPREVAADKTFSDSRGNRKLTRQTRNKRSDPLPRVRKCRLPSSDRRAEDYGNRTVLSSPVLFCYSVLVRLLQNDTLPACPPEPTSRDSETFFASSCDVQQEP